MDNTTLMHRVFTGQASEKEKSALENWQASSPDNLAEYEEMKLLYTDSWQPEEDEPSRFDDSWTRLQNAFHRAKVKTRRIKFLKMMGLSVGIYIFGMFFYSMMNSSRNPTSHEHSGELLIHTMHYNDALISDVTRSLEAYSDLRITLEFDALATCRFTGSFKGGTSLRKVIEALAKAKDLNVRYTSEQAVVLSGPPCKI